jgi:PilZ domain
MTKAACAKTLYPASFRCAQPPRPQANSNIRRLRLAARTKGKIPAILAKDAEIYPAEIRNVSVGGAGLSCAHSLQTDDAITLHLPAGRTLTAKVVWARMGFCGVAFDEQLAKNDVLLQQDARGHATATIASASRGGDSGNSRTWRVTATIDRFIARRRQRRAKAMLEVACRKQGFAWLTGDDAWP